MNKLLFLLLLCSGASASLLAQTYFTISGGHLRVSGSASLVLQDTEWNNNGSFRAGTGTVSVIGSGSDTLSAIGGDSLTTFYNLTINKTENGSLLKRAIQIDHELSMMNGNLDLNSHDLTLGSASGTLVGERNSSRILGPNGGVISKTVTANAPVTLNPGNIGVSLTSVANLGSLTIRRGHVAQTLNNNDPSLKGIDRYFEFTAENNAQLNLSAQIFYFADELNNGNSASDIGFWRQDSNYWFNPVKSIDVDNDTVVFVGGINLLSKWTLANESAKLRPKVFLEGAYTTPDGFMRDALRTNALLPTRTPYAGMDYGNGTLSGGETIRPAVLSDSESSRDDIVDWVFVELRPLENPSLVSYGRSALLQRDGSIVDLDGKSPVSIPGLSSGSLFFLSIRHRNHLGIRSLLPISSNTVPTSVNFTTSDSVVLGGANSLKLLPDGRYALFSGDFNGDGQIQIAGDLNGMIPTLGQSGYLPGDFDLNGQVQNNEIQLRLSPNLGRGTQFEY
ncbi:MAG: hypothetical protein AAGA31_04215 [Bacteroidota bacterium]